MHTSGFLTAPKLDSLRGYLPEAAYAGATDGIGIPLAQVSMIMTISQVSEVFMMLLLPFIIKRLGIAWTLWIGIIAWPLRFAIFAFLPMAAAVIPAMALHGLCIACFIVAGSVYVEQVASPEIRASAQGLYSSVTMGIGRVAGAIFAGYSLKQNTLTLPARVSLPGGTELDHLVAWGPLFAIPCGLTLAAAVAFPILFFYRPKVKV
jgi:MFS family permease